MDRAVDDAHSSPLRLKISKDLARRHWGRQADRAVDDDLCLCIGIHLFGLGGGSLHPRQRQGLGLHPLGLGGGSLHRLFTVLSSALSAGNLQAIQASLFEPKQRSHEPVFLQKPDLVYIWLVLITVG